MRIKLFTNTYTESLVKIIKTYTKVAQQYTLHIVHSLQTLSAYHTVTQTPTLQIFHCMTINNAKTISQTEDNGYAEMLHYLRKLFFLEYIQAQYPYRRCIVVYNYDILLLSNYCGSNWQACVYNCIETAYETKPVFQEKYFWSWAIVIFSESLCIIMWVFDIVLVGALLNSTIHSTRN